MAVYTVLSIDIEPQIDYYGYTLLSHTGSNVSVVITPNKKKKHKQMPNKPLHCKNSLSRRRNMSEKCQEP